MVRDRGNVGVGERVVADLMPFTVDAPNQILDRSGIGADDEEGRRDVIEVEHIEDRRRPPGIRAIIEREGNFPRALTAPSADDVRGGEGVEGFVRDEASLSIVCDSAAPGMRPRLDLQNLALALIFQREPARICPKTAVL